MVSAQRATSCSNLPSINQPSATPLNRFVCIPNPWGQFCCQAYFDSNVPHYRALGTVFVVQQYPIFCISCSEFYTEMPYFVGKIQPLWLMRAKIWFCAEMHAHPLFAQPHKPCTQIPFISVQWRRKEGSWGSNVNRMFRIGPFERFDSHVFENIFQDVFEHDGMRGSFWQRMCELWEFCRLLHYLEAQQQCLL